MRIEIDDVVLRDHTMEDIEDDVRWFGADNGWMADDTPWDDNAPQAECDTREEMKVYTKFLTQVGDKVLRPRLEVEYEGRHVGFVSFYWIDSNFHEDRKREHIALGIAICEKSARGKGIGRKALLAHMEYFRSFGYRDFFLETCTENLAMMKCAESIGFIPVKEEKRSHERNGRTWDEVWMKKTI